MSNESTGAAVGRVIVAENNLATRRRLERLLATEKLDVESVADGQEAIEKVGTAKPDLLLLDMVMPKLDGLQVIKKLRERGANVPVVLIATKSEIGTSVQRALQRGGMDYILKPVDGKELLMKVQRALASARRNSPLRVPLRELHDPETGRIDAKKVAQFLGIPLAKLTEALEASYPTVYKTPAAPSLQKSLRPVKRSLELISEVTRDPSEVRAWLNNEHPDLGGRTPMDVILKGRAGALVTLLENALAGIPS